MNTHQDPQAVITHLNGLTPGLEWRHDHGIYKSTLPGASHGPRMKHLMKDAYNLQIGVAGLIASIGSHQIGTILSSEPSFATPDEFKEMLKAYAKPQPKARTAAPLEPGAASDVAPEEAATEVAIEEPTPGATPVPATPLPLQSTQAAATPKPPKPDAYDGELTDEQIALALSHYTKRGWKYETAADRGLEGKFVTVDSTNHKTATQRQAQCQGLNSTIHEAFSACRLAAEKEAAEAYARKKLGKSFAETGELPNFLNRTTEVRLQHRADRQAGYGGR